MLASLLCALVAGPTGALAIETAAHAQGPGTAGSVIAPAFAVDEDPYDLVRTLDRRLTEARGLNYRATRQGHAAFATTITREGEVTASLHEGELLLRIDGHANELDGSTSKFLSAYDGETVTSIRHADEQVVTGPLDFTFGALGEAGAGLSSWLLLWNNHIGGAFRDGAEPYPLEYDGVALIDGQPCHVIRIGFDEYGGVAEYESWLYLDTETLLPRRVELGGYDDFADLGMIALTIDSIELLDSLPDGSFAVSAPAGYEVVEYEGADNFFTEQAMASSGGLAVGDAAPDWTLEDPDGNDFSLEDFRGRVVVMDFWATWCGPCIMAMPGLQALHEEFEGQPVSIIGVNCWENGDPAAFMEEKGFDYPLLVGGDAVAEAYGVQGIPTFYIVGPEGEIVHHEVGFDPEGKDRLREIIKDALPE